MVGQLINVLIKWELKKRNQHLFGDCILCGMPMILGEVCQLANVLF